ncbi:MAG: arylsulfatase A-like enzyme, partial [Myxococcota bacterium]
AGGFEAIKLSVTLKLSLTFLEGLLLALTSCLLGGLLAAGFGLLTGLVAQLLTRRWLDYRRHALSVAGVALLMGLWYLIPAAQDLYEQQRPQAALAFALTPLGIGGVIWFNAVFWLRREYIDEPLRLGWWFWSAAGALMLSLCSAAWLSQRAVNRVTALDADPDVLLVTFDTLRRDHVSMYGDSPVETPVLDALAAEGIAYHNAITPMPETLPAHSAIFTGLHPARNKVLSNGHTLSRGYPTLAGLLAEEGYATGAFVSSFAVDSRTGIDQGFQIYDDDFFPFVRGFSEIRAAHVGLKVVMRLFDPTDFPFLLERNAPVTYGRALDWIDSNTRRPTFAWVHLFEPHAPYEPHGLPGFEDNGTPGAPVLDHRDILSNEASFTYTDDVREKLRRLYAEEVAYSDQQLGMFLEQHAALGRDRPLLLIVTADHGEMLGEHGIEFTHHGIYDETLRIPLIIQPVRFSEMTRRVDEQVRLMDLFATVLKQLQLDIPEHTESGELVKFAELPNQRGYSSLLMGRRTASLSEGTLFGYRVQNSEGSNIKYILADDGSEQLYDLISDPGEQNNLAAEQPQIAASLRAKVEGEVRSAKIAELLQQTETDASTQEALRALGYIE